jgi:hypothetical protein
MFPMKDLRVDYQFLHLHQQDFKLEMPISDMNLLMDLIICIIFIDIGLLDEFLFNRK